MKQVSAALKEVELQAKFEEIYKQEYYVMEEKDNETERLKDEHRKDKVRALVAERQEDEMKMIVALNR